MFRVVSIKGMSRIGVYHLFTKNENSSITLQGKKQRVVSPYREKTASGTTLQGKTASGITLSGKKQRVVSPYWEKNSEWYHLTGKNSEWYHLTGKITASSITLLGK